ncbi:MAG: hypothetical protein A2X61_07720 [Ignavibacteria bacterium GWB2_35_12]|nr:MAG: hypothetical protein A2X61_07720 [Ignavibacteria bacterium GWB2_35_12]OGU90179.1 MAG: hypothetical protein A2220_16335 [Ignavibacteria bacterium RIFOXYA2_FULL_35_10]OGV21913.1 MAG: hypothetical protein A2475_09840 [Ignavibacteria bacterium RIFOXYC2_FULL_35_21]
MKKFYYLMASAVILISLIIVQSCSTIRQISQTLADLKRLQFKLENVNGFKVAGIDVTNKKTINDFSMMDGIKLTQAFATKKFPAEFVLNVAAKNPNDGKGGARQANATLNHLDWNLYIDDVKTINGDIANSVEIPGTGQSTIIPLSMGLDLYQFFGKQGYDKVINLALNIGGVGGSPTRLKLDAQPTVTTPLGPISYPGRLTIIDKEFIQ